MGRLRAAHSKRAYMRDATTASAVCWCARFVGVCDIYVAVCVCVVHVLYSMYGRESLSLSVSV